MSRSFATNQTLEVASTPVTAVPLTLAMWATLDTPANTRSFVVGVSGSDAECFYIGPNVTTGFLSAGSRTGGVTSSAISTAALSSSVLTHCCGVFTSATSRASFVGGANKGTNATSSTPTGLNAIRFGSAMDGSFDHLGLIAHPAIWNVALTDEEVAALGAGASPLTIRPWALVFYAPYLGRDSSEIDIVGGRILTVTGASASNTEPRISWPSRGRISQIRDKPLRDLRFYWGCESTTLGASDHTSGFDETGSLQNSGELNASFPRLGTYALRGPGSFNGGCSFSVDGSFKSSRLFPFRLSKNPLDTQGCVGFWSRQSTAVYSSGVQRAFRFRSASTATWSLESNFVTGGTNYAFVVGGSGGSNTLTTTGGVITANNYFFEVYRWDFPGGKLKIEIYDANLVLVDSIEQISISFTATNVPPDIESFIVGAKGGANPNPCDFDNFMVSDRYDAPLQNNALITNAAEYRMSGASLRTPTHPRVRAA